MNPGATLDDLTGPMSLALLAFALLAGARVLRGVQKGAALDAARIFARPTTPITAARADVAAKIAGVVVADDPITSPLTGRPGVRCEVVAHVDVGDGSRREVLAAVSRPFWIEDASGARIRVHPEGARVIDLPECFTVGEDLAARGALSDTQRAWVSGRVRDGRDARSVEEHLLAAGQGVIAVGAPHADGDGLSLGGRAPHALTLVVGSERAHRSAFAAARAVPRVLSRVGVASLAASLAWGAWALLR